MSKVGSREISEVRSSFWYQRFAEIFSRFVLYVKLLLVHFLGDLTGMEQLIEDFFICYMSHVNIVLREYAERPNPEPSAAKKARTDINGNRSISGKRRRKRKRVRKGAIPHPNTLAKWVFFCSNFSLKFFSVTVDVLWPFSRWIMWPCTMFWMTREFVIKFSIFEILEEICGARLWCLRKWHKNYNNWRNWNCLYVSYSMILLKNWFHNSNWPSCGACFRMCLTIMVLFKICNWV